LLKQGAKGVIYNRWKKRWFYYDESERKLFYYGGPVSNCSALIHQDDMKGGTRLQSKGYIDIGKATSIAVEEDPKVKFLFSITSLVGVGGRVYRLQASSDEEVK
jgi:hypothetical protein